MFTHSCGSKDLRAFGELIIFSVMAVLVGPGDIATTENPVANTFSPLGQRLANSLRLLLDFGAPAFRTFEGHGGGHFFAKLDWEIRDPSLIAAPNRED